MRNYEIYKTKLAQEFIEYCEDAGIGLSIDADELCVHFTAAACVSVRMCWFSGRLEWLHDEIAEIVARRDRRSHLRLVKS